MLVGSEEVVLIAWRGVFGLLFYFTHVYRGVLGDEAEERGFLHLAVIFISRFLFWIDLI